MAVAHLHERTAVHAYHHQVAHGEDKAVVAPQVVEGFARALAPVVLVVARDDIEGLGNAVENRLHVQQLLVAALVGEVAGHEHGVNVECVYLLHSQFEFALVGIAWGDVNVAKDCQLLRHQVGRQH